MSAADLEATEAESKPRRGRPKVPGLEEARREAIIASAFAVLAEKGYHHASMSDIARHARIGQGTLYRYFPSKRELLDHVFDYAVKKTTDALDLDELAAVDDYEHALPLVRSVGSRLYALTDAEPTLLRLVTVQSSAIDAELRHRVVGLVSMVDALMTPFIPKLAPDGAEAAQIDWATVGRMVLGMAGPGVVTSLLGETSPEPRTRHMHAAEAMVDRGLLTPPPPADNGADSPSSPSVRDVPAATTVAVAGDRRAQIYSAAVELFLDRGYYDVDVAHIVSSVGVSQGTFYNYFSNKRAVLEAIQRTVESQFTTVFAGERDVETLANRADFVAEFEARVTRATQYIVTNASLVQFVTLTGAGVDDDAFRLAATGYQRIGAAVTLLLRYAHGRGWVRDDVDLEFAGQAVVAAVVAAALPVLLDSGEDFDEDAVAQTCTVYVLSGVRGLAGLT